MLFVGDSVTRRGHMIEGLRELRRKRDSAKVEAALAELRKACETDSENLMPFIFCEVKAYATVGEINAAMKETFGEFKEPAFL